MSTLVDRLREAAHARWFNPRGLLVEAADEIDRLTALLEPSTEEGES